MISKYTEYLCKAKCTFVNQKQIITIKTEGQIKILLVMIRGAVPLGSSRTKCKDSMMNDLIMLHEGVQLNIKYNRIRQQSVVMAVQQLKAY